MARNAIKKMNAEHAQRQLELIAEPAGGNPRQAAAHIRQPEDGSGFKAGEAVVVKVQ